MKYLNEVSKDCVGRVCKSLNSGNFKILKYSGSKDVEIQFLKTGYCKVAEMKEVKTVMLKTRIHHPFMVLVYWVLNTHLRLKVLLQKSIHCGVIC